MNNFYLPNNQINNRNYVLVTTDRHNGDIW